MLFVLFSSCLRALFCYLFTLAIALPCRAHARHHDCTPVVSNCVQPMLYAHTWQLAHATLDGCFTAMNRAQQHLLACVSTAFPF